MASEIPVLQLAKDVLTETLHGPVPMRTVARLAQGVIAAETKLAAVRKLAVLGSDSPNKAIAELCQEFERLTNDK